MLDLTYEAPKDLNVKTTILEDLLAGNDRVDTQRVDSDLDLREVSLRRVVSEEMYETLERYEEAIAGVKNLTDYERTINALSKIDSVRISSNGSVFLGYIIMSNTTDSYLRSTTSALVFSSVGKLEMVEGVETPLTQAELDEIVKSMLEALRQRKQDDRKMIGMLLNLRESSQNGVNVSTLNNVQKLDPNLSDKTNDTLTKARLSAIELQRRLNQIKTALQHRAQELSAMRS